MTRADPRVTIGLPTYNGERFLAEAVASLLAQDLGDLELLLADNASTDGNRDICESFARADPRVRYLPADRNRGAAWNFNRVGAEARAPLFKWAADDDTYEREFLRLCLDVLDAEPDVVLAYTQAVEIDSCGAVLEARGPTNVADLPDPAERFRAVVLREVYCYSVFGVIRTEALRATRLIGGFSQSDRVLLAELALEGRFVEVDRPCFRHREHPGRSMYVYVSDRERQRWFDPDRDGSLTMPWWRLGAEYARALRRDVPSLDPAQRRRAASAVASWVALNRRTLSRELARTTALRASRRLHRLRSGDTAAAGATAPDR